MKKKAERTKVDVEFYVVSGGLLEVVEGSRTITRYFRGVYASQLAPDTPDGVLKYVKRCVTFTEKTRYLFEINKGLDAKQTRKNPFLVNKDIPLSRRPIPFKNMIYVGDGLTDIPCFSLVQNFGGTAFGVFEPTKRKSAKRALIEFLRPKRVMSMHAPKYRETDELGSLLRQAVLTRCSNIRLEYKQAQRSGL